MQLLVIIPVTMQVNPSWGHQLGNKSEVRNLVAYHDLAAERHKGERESDGIHR